MKALKKFIGKNMRNCLKQKSGKVLDLSQKIITPTSIQGQSIEFTKKQLTNFSTKCVCVCVSSNRRWTEYNELKQAKWVCPFSIWSEHEEMTDSNKQNKKLDKKITEMMKRWRSSGDAAVNDWIDHHCYSFMERKRCLAMVSDQPTCHREQGQKYDTRKKT